MVIRYQCFLMHLNQLQKFFVNMDKFRLKNQSVWFKKDLVTSGVREGVKTSFAGQSHVPATGPCLISF